jgi:CelD/BcsL family acetyltransferase involved in cellulose biosynthesis
MERSKTMKEFGSHDSTLPVSFLHAVEVDVHRDPRWEALVNTLPNSQVYHHPAWLQVLEETYGFKPVNLACEDRNGKLQGILPLFHMRGLLRGRSFSSLPLTPLAGPLAYNEQAATILMQEAVERVSKEPGTRLHLKTLSNEFDGMVDGLIGVSERSTYLLTLPEPPKPLPLASQIRQAVNKASRLGVEVHPAETIAELQAWYKLYLETMHRVSGIPRPYRFFEIAWQRLQPRKLLRLLLASHYEAGRARLLGGLLLLQCGQTVCYSEGGWNREEQALRPNDALHWRAIQDAYEEGFRYYDFGTIPEGNLSLARYKLKWGAERVSMYSYFYPASCALESNILTERNRARQFMSVTWRWLPIGAIGFLSGWAHRYL